MSYKFVILYSGFKWRDLPGNAKNNGEWFCREFWENFGNYAEIGI